VSKKDEGLKSALDLAMERLGGEGPTLTTGQKEALAEVDRETEAKIAEVKIMSEQRLLQARAKGDAEGIRELEAGRTAEIGGILAKAEEKKERIRDGA
jgi:hypothetical protein